jgi:hypothetical protein
MADALARGEIQPAKPLGGRSCQAPKKKKGPLE